MARRPNISGCVFCDPEPCQCGVKPKKAKVPRQRKTDVAPEPPPPVKPEPAKPSALDAMRQAAQAAQLQRKREMPAPTVSPAIVRLTGEDAMMLQALRLLKDTFGEIDGPDLEKYKELLSKPATTRERALAWTERRRLNS